MSTFNFNFNFVFAFQISTIFSDAIKNAPDAMNIDPIFMEIPDVENVTSTKTNSFVCSLSFFVASK